MKNRVGVLIFIFLFSAFGGYAQSKLIVSAPDSLAFLLFVDDSQITNSLSFVTNDGSTGGRGETGFIEQVSESSSGNKFGLVFIWFKSGAMY